MIIVILAKKVLISWKIKPKHNFLLSKLQNFFLAKNMVLINIFCQIVLTLKELKN